MEKYTLAGLITLIVVLQQNANAEIGFRKQNGTTDTGFKYSCVITCSDTQRCYNNVNPCDTTNTTAWTDCCGSGFTSSKPRSVLKK